MTLLLLLVLLAALMHASWNALLKAARDRWLTFAVVSATGALLFLPVVIHLGPPDKSAWPYLGASALIHLGYFSFLIVAYTHGDFSQVYPIARGIGPLLVALYSALVLGEPLGRATWIGIALVCSGVMALASGSALGAKRGVAFAALTGVFIAAYTLSDGLGVRAEPSRLGYIAWLHVLIGVPFSSAVLLARRASLRVFLAEHGARAAGAGVLAALAYSLVIHAMSKLEISVVAALREVSVVFAAAIGARLLGEPFGRRRTLAAVVVVAGIAALSLSR